jgi:hypothetical protein
MKNGCKICSFVVAPFIALLLSGCVGGADERGRAAAGAAMLLDADTRPTASALMRLGERRTFPVDERRRTYAMREDQADKNPPGGKPLRVMEARP